MIQDDAIVKTNARDVQYIYVPDLLLETVEKDPKAGMGYKCTIQLLLGHALVLFRQQLNLLLHCMLLLTQFNISTLKLCVYI